MLSELPSQKHKMGQGESTLGERLPVSGVQLPSELQREIRNSRRSNNYMLANKVRVEVYRNTELPVWYPVWKVKGRDEVPQFTNVVSQAGYGFVFGMMFRGPADFYGGLKEANWRPSGGFGKVFRETHYSAGRFASFLGLLYFFESCTYTATGYANKEATVFSAFWTGSLLACTHGRKTAAVQGLVSASFMWVLVCIKNMFLN